MARYNILIIEDERIKLHILKKAIENNNAKQSEFEFNVFPDGDLGDFTQEIKSKTEKELFSYVVDIMKRDKIDLLILDFYLANGDTVNNQGVEIEKSTGYGLLKKIRDDHTKISHIPIFSYTKKQEELNKQADRLSGMIQGAIPKKDDWESQYESIKSQISARMFVESEMYAKIKEVDILVICAIKKEFKYIKGLWDEADRREVDDMQFEAELQRDGNDPLRIAAVTNETMGMAEAATLATNMIATYNPKFVVMTGIAAGIVRGDQNFLDILMPKNIYNWQAGKFKVINKTRVLEKDYTSVDTYYGINNERNGKIREQFESDIKKLHKEFLKKKNSGKYPLDIEKEYKKEELEKIFKSTIESILKKDASDIEEGFEEELRKYIKPKGADKPKKFQERITNLVNIWKNLSPTIRTEKMSSGSAVVADEKIVEEFIIDRKMEGIDMEAYGVVYACRYARSKPNPIIMKAISDFADSKKNDLYQEIASYVSAQAFYLLFTKYIDISSKN